MIVAWMVLAVGLQRGGLTPADYLVEGYKPPWTPSVVGGFAQGTTTAATDSYRGYRTITTEWVVERPIQSVAESLSHEFMLWNYSSKTTKQELDMRGVSGFKVLADRVVQVYTNQGREVTRERDKYIETVFEDKDRFTTIYLWEMPLKTGPMPKSWPELARMGLSYPVAAPSPPLKELRRRPDEWMITWAAGGYGYIFNWYIHEPVSKCFPRLKRALEGVGNWQFWKVPEVPTVFREVRATLKPPGYLNRVPPYISWLDFHAMGPEVGDLSGDWCKISMNWIAGTKDPKLTFGGK